LNGELTTFEYDEFGRLRRAVHPGGTTVTRSYEFTGDPERQRIVDTVDDGSPDGLWARQYLDGLGRIYRVERKSERPNEVLAQSIVYGDASRYPHRISRSSRWRRSGPFRLRAARSFDYDEAGRLVRITTPDGATRRFAFEASANRLTTTATDELGENTQAVVDALQRLVEVRSFEGSQTIVTQYQYDAADQIRKIIDPNGNPTTYEWTPAAGRRSSGTTSSTASPRRSTPSAAPCAGPTTGPARPTGADASPRSSTSR
jgi:YD repeat-containing protein